MAKRRRPLVLAGAAVAVVLVGLVIARVATAPDTGQDPEFELVGDESVGGFATDGSTAAAIEAFGTPSRREEYGRFICRLEWAARGITMEIAFEGAVDPCRPGGNHRWTTVADPRWATDEGLRVGDPEARVPELYPDSEPDGEGNVTLLTRDVAGLPIASLTAQVENGKVTSLTVYGPRRAF